jgi:hypothetical protein
VALEGAGDATDGGILALARPQVFNVLHDLQVVSPPRDKAVLAFKRLGPCDHCGERVVVVEHGELLLHQREGG